ncbi:hypothetical protein NIES4075_69750 [Tolypothrix sp. NIES-4075]|uniref:hypothetical protein n=1 Tax=Tolypothrix sp. NIES-4075 TaxID=2005459 RepID=UPI000B5CFDDF|nr:hypothetical protein [Tolypothrix sp. NIES-4075]GAX45954.1 hypothetical protein NIES4075_69750 [Tolypothrix sp. NIES-4075]
MTKEKLLQAMAAMVAARDWQGFLHLRRLLRQSLDSGFTGELRKFLNSLPEEDLDAYVNYFGVSLELPKNIWQVKKAELNQKFIDAREAPTLPKPKLKNL